MLTINNLRNVLLLLNLNDVGGLRSNLGVCLMLLGQYPSS